MGYSHLNTFDDVVSWYERTKPVVGSVRKREEDIRPIGKRSRVWERIMKVDDNTYALLDGCYAYGSAYDTATVAMAPIVWTRTPDGDYIRLRNHRVGCGARSRYDFLYKYTPRNMTFKRNGNRTYFHVKTKQWTDGVSRFEYEDFPLPKCDFHFDWNTKQITRDDNTYLMFRVNNDGTFTRTGEILCATPHIDKDLKKSLKPHIASFYQFCAAIAPMLDISWQAISEYREQLNGGKSVPHRYAVHRELAREIVSQEDHELRVALAALIIAWCNAKREIRSESDLKSIKAAYNRVINKVLGLYTVEAK